MREADYYVKMAEKLLREKGYEDWPVKVDPRSAARPDGLTLLVIVPGVDEPQPIPLGDTGAHGLVGNLGNLASLEKEDPEESLRFQIRRLICEYGQ